MAGQKAKKDAKHEGKPPPTASSTSTAKSDSKGKGAKGKGFKKFASVVKTASIVSSGNGKKSKGAEPEILEEDEKQSEHRRENEREQERLRKEQEQAVIEMHAKLMEEEQLKMREREISIEECVVELRTVIASAQIFELELQDVMDELREAEEERQRRLTEERERLAWILFWNAKASHEKKKRGTEVAANDKQAAGAGRMHADTRFGTRAGARGYQGGGGRAPSDRHRDAHEPSKYVSPREVRAKRAGSRRLADTTSRQEEGRGGRVGAVCDGGKGNVDGEGDMSSAARPDHSARDFGHVDGAPCRPGRPGAPPPSSARIHSARQGVDGVRRDGSHRNRRRTHRLWEAGAGAERREGAEDQGPAGRRTKESIQGDHQGAGLGDKVPTGLPAIMTPRERALQCFRGSPSLAG